MQQYRAGAFGQVVPSSPFGDNMSRGLMDYIDHFYAAANPKGFWHTRSRVPWLGVFQLPETFSKAAAASPLSKKGVSQYPAIFYLEKDLHTMAMQCGPLPIKVMNYIRLTTPHDDDQGCDAICISNKGSFNKQT